MPWRCVNHITGYCSNEPDWDIHPVKKEVPVDKEHTIVWGEVAGTCKLDRTTCGKYMSHTPAEEQVLKESEYHHKIVPVENKDTEKKSKIKEVKKENLQGTLL